MNVHRCHACGNTFDFDALVHHLKTDSGCPDAEAVNASCDWHFHNCPWSDQTYRDQAGDWNPKTWRKDRTCHPVYRLAAGIDPTRPPGHQAMTWLTLTPTPATLKPKAPRPFGRAA